METLLEPVRFRNGALARNRVALAAMTNRQSHADGSLGEEELRWLLRRAEGGFGIVTTCAAHVAKDGQGWPGELGVFDDGLLPGLTRLARELRERGALGFVQLYHGGLRADPEVTGCERWSASEHELEDRPRVRAASEEDIRRVIGQFAAAARRAHEAGFDGVEIHGAHGYLLTQFLSREENRRADAWGGPLANRARLIREVTRAVRASVPDSFVVGVRVSPEDAGNAHGLDLDESVRVVRWLCEDGADYLHLSRPLALAPSAKHPDRHTLELFRPVVPAEVLLFTAGQVWTRAEAERLLELGADVVALARSGIVNPDWPLLAGDPQWEPRRPPLTPAELGELAVSPGFVEYLRRWQNFVEPWDG
jgi:2,4-dienoyl-CoA reductase-like NADH-dependent reductase (Old Yellow Enzyme family)